MDRCRTRAPEDLNSYLGGFAVSAPGWSAAVFDDDGMFAIGVRGVKKSGEAAVMQKADKIYLVGFMGAGKSTVARALARRLDWRVEDIDAHIERQAGQDIAGIFRQHGEPYFRSLERSALLDLLGLRGTVVAAGGGTFVDAANRELMLRDGVVIWLARIMPKPTSTPPMVATVRGPMRSCIRPAGTMTKANTRHATA